MLQNCFLIVITKRCRTYPKPFILTIETRPMYIKSFCLNERVLHRQYVPHVHNVHNNTSLLTCTQCLQKYKLFSYEHKYTINMKPIKIISSKPYTMQCLIAQSLFPIRSNLKKVYFCIPLFFISNSHL